MRSPRFSLAGAASAQRGRRAPSTLVSRPRRSACAARRAGPRAGAPRPASGCRASSAASISRVSMVWRASGEVALGRAARSRDRRRGRGGRAPSDRGRARAREVRLRQLARGASWRLRAAAPPALAAPRLSTTMKPRSPRCSGAHGVWPSETARRRVDLLHLAVGDRDALQRGDRRCRPRRRRGRRAGSRSPRRGRGCPCARRARRGRRRSAPHHDLGARLRVGDEHARRPARRPRRARRPARRGAA